MAGAVLVVGASGRLGQALTAELLSRHQVLAGVRRPDQAELPPGAEAVRIDLRQPAGIEAALDQSNQVVTAVQGLTARAADSIMRVDVEGHKRLIDAAALKGISRFVYTSTQGASPDHPAPFLRAKAAVERHLIASGLDYAIIRPSAFMDLYAHELIGARVLAGKRAVLLGSGDIRRNLVAVADVAAAVAALLEAEGSLRRVFEIGGPDNLTDREVAALYGDLAARPPRITALPAPAVRLLAALLRPLHSGLANILRFPLQTGSRGDLASDAAELTRLIGRPPLDLKAFAGAAAARRKVG